MAAISNIHGERKLSDHFGVAADVSVRPESDPEGTEDVLRNRSREDSRRASADRMDRHVSSQQS